MMLYGIFYPMQILSRQVDVYNFLRSLLSVLSGITNHAINAKRF
jgi:hypothetical protein